MAVLDIVLKLDEEIGKVIRGELEKSEAVITESEYEELRRVLRFNSLDIKNALSFQEHSGYAINYNGLRVIIEEK